VIITEGGPERFVAVLFSDERFPGIRFGHRIRTPSAIFLKLPLAGDLGIHSDSSAGVLDGQ